MEELLGILKAMHPRVDFETEKRLVDENILDSFDLATLMSEIWEHFGVEINAEDLTPRNFNSAEAIYALIQSADV